MKTKVNTKRYYLTPTIELVKLDNEISLILESSPPKGPTEVKNTPEYFNNDPFKSNMG
jgi:hypothetical protein